MTEFLHKNPEKALMQVREKLYDRLGVLRQCIGPDVTLQDAIDTQMLNELDFIEGLLDQIERS